MKSAMMSLGLVAAIGAGSARADEESIPVKDLPELVVVAVKARCPGGKLAKAAKEEEDGKTIYEVVVEDDGETTEVAVTPKGKILEVETTIAADKLPERVAAALKAKYPKAKIKKAEKIVAYDEDDDDDDGDKYFEVVLSVEGKGDVEVKLTPKGKPVEEDDDDDKAKAKKKKDKDDDDDDDDDDKKGDKVKAKKKKGDKDAG